MGRFSIIATNKHSKRFFKYKCQPFNNECILNTLIELENKKVERVEKVEKVENDNPKIDNQNDDSFTDLLIKNGQTIMSGYSKKFTLTTYKPINRGDQPATIKDLWIDYEIEFSDLGNINIWITNISNEKIKIRKIGPDIPGSDMYTFRTNSIKSNSYSYYSMNNNVLSFISNIDDVSSWDIKFKIGLSNDAQIKYTNKEISFLGMNFVLEYDKKQFTIPDVHSVESSIKSSLIVPSDQFKVDIIPSWIKYAINRTNLKFEFIDDDEEPIVSNLLFKNILNTTDTVINGGCNCK